MYLVLKWKSLETLILTFFAIHCWGLDEMENISLYFQPTILANALPGAHWVKDKETR